MSLKKQKYKPGDKFVVTIAEVYDTRRSKSNERPDHIYRLKHFNGATWTEDGLDKLEKFEGNYSKEQVSEIIDDAVAYFADVLTMISSKMIEDYYDTDSEQDAEEAAIRAEALTWVESRIIEAQAMFIKSYSDIYYEDCGEEDYETDY